MLLGRFGTVARDATSRPVKKKEKKNKPSLSLFTCKHEVIFLYYSLPSISQIPGGTPRRRALIILITAVLKTIFFFN